MIKFKRGLSWYKKRIISEYHTPTKKISKYIKKWLIKYNPSNNTTDKLEREYKENFLFFFYDLDIAPIAYDVAGFLAAADLERQKLSLEFIYIIIVPGREKGFRLEVPEYDDVVNIEERHFRLWNLVIPMFSLLPSLNGFKICNDRNEAKFIQKKLKNNFFPRNWKEEIPSYPLRKDIFKNKIEHNLNLQNLRATNQAIDYVSKYTKSFLNNKKLIVITIRDYEYTPKKNSNKEAWFKFADSLDERIYEVLFIPDTSNALISYKNYFGRKTLEVAAFNIQIRMAIYEAAYLNLAINQGPMELCWYNKKCNYIMFFKAGNSPITSESQLKSEGIIINKTPTFASKFQKWVWSEDNFDTIIKEFSLMSMLMEMECKSGYK